MRSFRFYGARKATQILLSFQSQPVFLFIPLRSQRLCVSPSSLKLLNS
jgi:hypothetical protein